MSVTLIEDNSEIRDADLNHKVYSKSASGVSGSFAFYQSKEKKKAGFQPEGFKPKSYMRLNKHSKGPAHSYMEFISH